MPTGSREDQLEAARAVALRILSGAPRSAKQLGDSLRQRGHADDVVEEIVERYVDVGLLDDAALAGMVTRSRLAERGLSRRGIAADLRRRGIGDDDIAGALEQVDDDTELEAARTVARARLRRTVGLDRDVRVRRAVGTLARKGYSPGLALRVVSEELGVERDELADASDLDDA
ncbi:regulatory protein RecX [Luteimicrobium subarcticum]|uniref:Regulatory protein RecX n=1 Tax=Luteimicrobium subarcticum TaxID=620910 RepID=A0A2M8WTW4_9MICO|nr:regulatory protein RecX [Luteimicrobium subarcticum]PJI94377.1 regulatory protein [Luteimicrobium subarcticum]